MALCNWKEVDLNLLVAFQALYQCQSVSLAAQQCFVSQSAMSHTLQRLRALFDDPLFERTGTRMMPTHRAQVIAPTIADLLATIQNDLLVQTEFLVAEFKGVWKIGLTDYAEQLFAPCLYDAIMEESPSSQIRFYHVNRSNYRHVIENEHVDVVIGSFDDLDRRFLAEKLYREQHLCLFDPKSLPFKNTLSIDDFTSVNHALVSPDGRVETNIDKTLAALGRKRRVVVTSRHFLTIRQLLLERPLLCVVPKRFAESEMYHHALKSLPAPIPVEDFDISVIYLKTQQYNEQNRWLRECVTNTITARS